MKIINNTLSHTLLGKYNVEHQLFTVRKVLLARQERRKPDRGPTDLASRGCELKQPP
ncbi:hypothetical protein D3C73_1304870 [compost metagenome]